MANTLMQIEQELIDYLQLQDRVVGIKRLETEQDYTSCSFDPVKGGLYYCYMVKMATRGKGLKAHKAHFACETAGKVIGIDKYYPDDSGIDGWEAIDVYNSRMLAEDKHHYLRPETERKYGVSVAPLGDYDHEPESVILVVNAYQLMRVLQGYHYHFSQNKSIRMSGMCGVCFESTMRPIVKQDLNVSMLCSGTRFICKWADDVMMVSLPYSQMEQVVDGIKRTANPCEMDFKKEQINQIFDKKEKLSIGTGYYLPFKEK